jgi:predicted DNA binding CopG/RHH family protein
MKKVKLDTYEQDMLESFEHDNMKSVITSNNQLQKYRAAARDTFIKDRRVNIRLSTPDLMDIQEKAAEEGLPYQTLIASILHKYVSGKLVERPARRLTAQSTRTVLQHTEL